MNLRCSSNKIIVIERESFYRKKKLNIKREIKKDALLHITHNYTIFKLFHSYSVLSIIHRNSVKKSI